MITNRKSFKVKIISNCVLRNSIRFFILEQMANSEEMEQIVQLIFDLLVSSFSSVDCWEEKISQGWNMNRFMLMFVKILWDYLLLSSMMSMMLSSMMSVMHMGEWEEETPINWFWCVLRLYVMIVWCIPLVWFVLVWFIMMNWMSWSH